MSDSSAALKAPPLAESEIDRHAAEIKPAWEGVSKSNRPPHAATLTEMDIDPMQHVPPPPMTATDMDRAFQAASLAPRPEAPVFEDDYQLPQKRPLSPVAKKVIFGVLGLAGLVTVGGFVRYLVAPKTDEDVSESAKAVAPPKVETSAAQPPITQPPTVAKEPPPPPEPVKVEPKPQAANQVEPAKTEPAKAAPVKAEPIKPEPVRAPEPVKATAPAPKPVAVAAPKPAPKPAAPAKPRSGIDRDNPF